MYSRLLDQPASQNIVNVGNLKQRPLAATQCVTHTHKKEKNTPIHKQDIIEIDLCTIVSARHLLWPLSLQRQTRRHKGPYRNVCVFPNVHARMRLDNLLQRSLGVRLLACHHGGCFGVASEIALLW